MNVPNLIEFILGLALLIILHELGHFLVARLLKIEVEEFGIGFPPRIVKLFEAGGTEFTLNWIPLGGFVRPKGENDPEIEGGLAAAPPLKRLAVLFAGPLMNISLGIILAIWLFSMYGVPQEDVVQIKAVSEGSPAAAAGLMADDILISINDTPVETAEDVIAIVSQAANQPTVFTYRRGDQVQSITIVPEPDESNEGKIGVGLGPAVKDADLGTAVLSGFDLTRDYITSLVMLPVGMIQGDISPEEGRPVGYKGMFDIYNQLENPLYFFMIVTLSLGVLNLMPIPALDGGRIVLTLPELLLRKRIPPQYENMIHLIGFALLLILIIWINIQDFINPVNLN